MKDLSKKIENESLNWTREPVRDMLITRAGDDTRNLSSFEIIKLSRFSNISSEKNRKDISFLDLMSSVLKYAKTFQDAYGAGFLHARNVDIAEEMLASKFWMEKS